MYQCYPTTCPTCGRCPTCGQGGSWGYPTYTWGTNYKSAQEQLEQLKEWIESQSKPQSVSIDIETTTTTTKENN